MIIPTRHAPSILIIIIMVRRCWKPWAAARGRFKCHACRVMPSVACLWTPLTCDGNTAISLAAPFKLVLMMKQKKRKRPEKQLKIKEFYEQLSEYPWQCRVLIKKGSLGSILSLPVEVKEFDVIYHVTTFLNLISPRRGRYIYIPCFLAFPGLGGKIF